jgi:hypothetical protein
MEVMVELTDKEFEVFVDGRVLITNDASLKLSIYVQRSSCFRKLFPASRMALARGGYRHAQPGVFRNYA